MDSHTLSTRREASDDKWKPRWVLKKMASGEMHFVPIRKAKVKKSQVVSLNATLTSRIVNNEGQVKSICQAMSSAGYTPVVRGRKISVDVEDGDVEALGEVFDALGCEWDAQ